MRKRKKGKIDLLNRAIVMLLTVAMVTTSSHIPTIFADTGGLATASEPIRISSESLEDSGEINLDENTEIDLSEARNASISADEEDEFPNAQTEGIFRYITKEGNAVIVGLVDGTTDTNITIPDTLGGMNVTEIEHRAFYFKNLESVTLGTHIEKIGDYAFAGNNLTSIVFPDSLKEIEENAFRDNSLENVNLNKVEKLGMEAFIDNNILTLNLGDSIVEIGDNAFKNNHIEEVNIPDTLTRVGENIFSYNGKFVKAISNAEPLNIPAVQKVRGGYGYVINPVKIKISYVDNETGAKLLDDATIGDDLSSLTDVFASGSQNTYTPPTISGYEPVLEEGNTDGNITFTPSGDDFELVVKYKKKTSGLILKANPSNKPMIAVNATDVEEKLRSFIIATNAAGEDLKASVEIEPSTIDVSTEGRTHEVIYTLRDETSGEVQRLKLEVYVGLDMNNFPLGNNWVLGDFVYGTGGSDNQVIGLSNQGKTKAATNKELVLPHINPTTGTRITVVTEGSGNITKINSIQFTSIKDFDGNIEEVKYGAFRNLRALTTVDLPNVKKIESNAFENTVALTEFDFSNVEELGSSVFRYGGLKKLIAPKLTKAYSESFRGTQIGFDPDYPQGFYTPELTTMPDWFFADSKLTYIDRAEQMPKATVIGGSAFRGNDIVKADLAGIEDIKSSAFYSQRNRALESINIPDAKNIDNHVFYNNKLTSAKLPKVENIGNSAFQNNELAKLEAPELKTIGTYAFQNNKLTELDLPKLTTIGNQGFARNLIKQAKLQNIETIDRDAFWNENYQDGNNDGQPDFNPGLKSLGNFIPIYTKADTTASSRENYIINPPEERYSGEYTDDDFTWDATDPNKVTGFTNKGKLKLDGNDYKLQLPDRATSVADNAFRWHKLRSVSANNVTTVGNNSFDRNPLSSVDMPNLTTIGNDAFSQNVAADGAKLTKINLDNARSIGDRAFYNSGLEGKLSIPNLELVNSSTFASNAITSVNAPVLKEIKNSGFSSNRLTSLDTEQFPVIEKLENYAFYNSMVRSIDLPTLKEIQGNSTFSFDTNIDKPIVWTMPENLKVTDKGGFQGYLFNYSDTAKEPRGIGKSQPGGIVLSNPPNADGTLNRPSTVTYTEVKQNSSYSYNGKNNIRTTYRRVLFDPSTVKVNYRLDTGESFDGRDGRPYRPDFREYIYEEQDRDLNTGVLPTAKKYTAPDFGEYILVSSTVQGATVAGRKEIDLPFEEQGSRTDREITFTYKKLQVDTLTGPKLSYGVSNAQGVISSQTSDYTANYPGTNALLPQMLTSFNIEEVKKTIKNGKIKINIDSPYIDPNSITVANSEATRAWYKDNAWRVVDGGIEIDLNPNIPVSSSIRNVVIGYRFKTNETPEGAKANLKMRLWDKDDNGNDSIIAEAENVELNLRYNPAPTITVKAPLNIKNYDYSGYNDTSNGPRDMGDLEASGEDLKVVNNPAYFPYSYTVGNIYYNIDAVTLRTVLPTYTAIENGVEVTKTAIFDAEANPAWTLSEDGTTVISKTTFPPTRSDWQINYRLLPKLKLRFPGLKANTNVVNKTYAEISPARDPRDVENAGKTIQANGDMGVGDQLVTYSPSVLNPKLPTGEIGAGKNPVMYPRYIYDNSDYRSKEIAYNLYISSANETIDFKNASIIDYDLDSRLKYTGIRFNETKANTEIRLRAYKKIGDNINPENDTLIFDRTVPVNKNRGTAIPEADIDYLKMDVVGTDVNPLDGAVSVVVVTKLKNPEEKLFDESEGASTNVLKNKGMFLGDSYNKATGELISQKKTDPKYENISQTWSYENQTEIRILEYKANVKVRKSLTHDSNPSGYRRFPALESGEVVISGERGAYHIMLDSKVEGSDNRANVVLNNLKVIDVIPKGIKVDKNDIVLDQYFLRAGGKFKILEDYETIEDGQSVKRRAIEFTSPKYDTRLYRDANGRDVPLRIASINAQYTGEAMQPVLTNKVYAAWEADNVNVVSPAQNALKDKYLDPHGQEIANGGQMYSYDEASIKVTASSGLVSREWIRNKVDNIWQEDIPTKSEEPFDYKMLVTNYDISANSIPYKGLDIINVFPEVNDYKLNKTGLRGSEFANTIDLTRIATDLKIPDGYKVTYLNTDTAVRDLLDGKNMDDLVKDNTLVWSDTPATNTKMVRITAIGDKTLGGGEELEIHIPMKAPKLTGFEDAMVGKKAVDSFVVRHYEQGSTTEYRNFTEPNSVFNYMELPEGSITFTKFGKEGDAIPNAQATPLEGAGFELLDASVNPNKVIAVAYSDSEGKVKFENLDISKSYRIQEFQAPDGYRRTTNTTVISKNEFKTVENSGYAYVLSDNSSKANFMNVKPVVGKIKINKKARDGSPLENITFKIKGEEASNNSIDEELMTAADGTITLENLPEGRYRISEIELASANRYQKAGDQVVVVRAGQNEYNLNFVNDKFQVLFRKLLVSNESALNPATWDTLTDFGNTRAAGYKFKVEGDGQTFTTNATNNQGEVILQNLKTEVEYTVTELPMAQQNARNKNLYKHNNREYKFKITNEGNLINTANNTRFTQYALNIPNIAKDIKGEVSVKKTDNSNPARAVAGAKLGIYKISLDNEGNIASSTKVSEQTTAMQGNDAIAKFTDLEPGLYQIKEEEAPAGYAISKAVLEVNIPSSIAESMLNDNAYDKTDENNIVYRLERNLINIPTKIEGIKGNDVEGQKNISLADAIDYVNRKKAEIPNITYRMTGTNIATVYVPLQGVKFELYKLVNGEKSGSAIEIDGSTDLVTDNEGKINFGSYKFDFSTEYGLYEKESIDGYAPYEGVKRINLSEEAKKPGFNGTYTFYINNEKEQGSILVSKYDSIQRTSLLGATFALYKGDMASADFTKPIKTIVTGTDGIVFFDKLNLGKYVLRELSAPQGYKQPQTGTRDLEIEINREKPYYKLIVFNTKLIDIDVKKEWVGGSEASVNIKLLRSTSRNVSQTGTAVVVDGLTDTNGIVTLNAANEWKTKFVGMEMADASGRPYYYQAEEVDVDANLYDKVIAGTKETGFTITNTATDENKTQIAVTKDWSFADGREILEGSKVEVVLKKVTSGARLPIAASDTTVEVERFTLSAENEWKHVFTNLPKRENGAEIIYRVEEVGTVAGFAAPEYAYDENTKNMTITNKAIDRNIEVEKKWVGVDPTKAPEVLVQLFDKEDMSNPIATKALTLENNKYIAKFENVPSYAYTVAQDGSINARKIQYELREKYADNRVRPAYTSTNDMDDTKFATYSTDANMASDISATITNTMATQNITLNKTWVGVEANEAPAVSLQLVDVTDDSSADLSEETTHKNVGTAITLDNTNNFSSTVENLPRYREDGITEIKYIAKELNTRAGYTYSYEVNRAQDGNITINATNTREKISLGLSKTWIGVDSLYRNVERSYPSVKVHIWADETNDNTYNPRELTDLGTIELNANNEYKANIPNLNKYAANGVDEIKYYAIEEALTGFRNTNAPADGSGIIFSLDTESGILKANIENTEDKLNVQVEKKWVGLDKYPENVRVNLPAINIDLYDATDSNNEILVDNRVANLEADTTDTSGSTFKTVFTDLPKYKYDTEGNAIEIVYKVKERQESSLLGYNVTYSEKEVIDASNQKYTITNTVKEKEISLSKTWIGKEENSIEVKLKKNGEDFRTVTVSKNTSGSNDYSYKFTNLAYYEIDGTTEINYTLEETPMSGYSSNIVRTDVNIENSTDTKTEFAITNTYNTVDLEVSKTWVGVENENAPEISLQLVDETDRDNVEDVVGKTVVLNSGNSFKARLEDLPKYKADGVTAIKYSFKESPALDGYEYRVLGTDFKTETQLSEEEKMDSPFGKWEVQVSNTRVMQDLIIKKTWADDLSGYTRPEVTFNLLADETDDNVENPSLIGTYTLRASENADENWQIKLNRPKYAANGTTLIKYYAEENPVAGYNTPVGMVELVANAESLALETTFNNSLKTRNVFVEKTWEGLDKYKSDALTNLPEIHIQLLDVTDENAPINVRDAKVLVEENGIWKTSFENLPYYKQDGTREIKYAIKEVEENTLVGYETTYQEAEDVNGSDIKLALTNKVKTIPITVNKTWEGVEANLAPQVVLSLTSTDTSLDLTNKKVTLNTGNNFSSTIENMPKYNIDGTTLVQYNVSEDTTLAGYTFSTNAGLNGETNTSLSINATNTRVTRPIKLKKTWADDLSGYERPDVVFKLYKNTTNDADTATEYKTFILSNETNPIFEAEADVPKYAEDGTTELYYYVGEDAIDGYNSPSGKVALSLDGEVLSASLENSLKVRDVNIEKTWEGLELYTNEAQAKLPEVKVDLYDITDIDNPIKVRETKTLEKGADGVYRAKFEKLPEFKEDGRTSIVYKVQELRDEKLVGYIASYETPVVDAQNNINLAIKNKVDTININAKKNWERTEVANAPEVKLALRSNDSSIDLTGKELDLNNTNNFSGSFGNLPKYSIDGKKIEYSLEELTTKRGYSFKQAKEEGIADISLEGTNERLITNAHLQKTWADDLSGYERPDVTFKLYKSSDEVNFTEINSVLDVDNSVLPIGNIVLSKNNNWSVNISNLPKYEEDGETPITYYVGEEEVAGYKPTAKVKLESDALDENNLVASIENELITRNVLVEKTWAGLDAYNADSLAKLPNVEVSLYDVTNGEKILVRQAKVLDRENATWTASFENLPYYKQDGTTAIEYKVEESTKLDGFVATYEENLVGDDIKFDITNTAKTIKVNASKLWLGTEASLAPNVSLALIDKDKIGDINLANKKFALSEANAWTDTLLDLPMYHIDGNTLVNYGLDEENPKSGYEFSYESSVEADEIKLVATNKRVTRGINLKKIWAGATSKYPRPSVSLRLYYKASGSDYIPANFTKDGIETNILVLDGSENYEATIDGFAKYDESGDNLLKYYVKEDMVAGYIIPEDYIELSTKEGSDTLYGELTNTLATIDIAVKKNFYGLEAYSDKELENLARVSAGLYDVTDGNSTLVATLPLEKNTRGELKATFSDVPRFKADGLTEIKYVIKEMEEPKLKGYKVSYSDKEVDENGNTSLDISNTVITRDISVEKTWKNPPFLVNEVKIHLLKNGERFGNPIILTGNEDTPWTYTINALPYYEADGTTLINYSIEEEEVLGYRGSISVKEVQTDAIDNTYTNLAFNVHNVFIGNVSGGNGKGGGSITGGIVNRFVDNTSPKPPTEDKEEVQTTDVSRAETDVDGDKSRRRRNLSLIPKTGDDVNIAPYIIVLFSVLIILIILIKKRKEKE